MNRLSQDPGYRQLKDYLIGSTGLAFYADRDESLTELIHRRLSALGMSDCFAYADFLADKHQGCAEMDLLIDRLTIGETYFFRDQAQFTAIRDIILPDILERNEASKQLRIWSAGCATGAEPYSLAILLARELAGRVAGWKVDIRATDLNREYLNQAEEGKFREWAFRTTPPEIKRDCFSKQGLHWVIHPRFKEWISFQQMNLAADDFPRPWPKGFLFDLILCRNVMIYFTPEVNRRLIGQLYNSLGDVGWLVVGAAEHGLDGYQSFRVSDVTEARIYQKSAMPAGPLNVTNKLEAAAAPVAKTLIEPSMPPARLYNPANMKGLRQLTDRSDWLGAAEYARILLAQDGLNPEIYFHQALIFENLGMATQAERVLRQAIYLDRNFALAHYRLGVALERDRQIPAAARSFENVLKVLAASSVETFVMAGSGITTTGLKELAKRHLEKSSGS